MILVITWRSFLKFLRTYRSRLMSVGLSSVISLCIIGLSVSIFNLQLSAKGYTASFAERSNVQFQLASLTRKLDQVSTEQAANGLAVFDPAITQNQLTLIRLDLQSGNAKAAQVRSDKLAADIADWSYELRLDQSRKLVATQMAATLAATQTVAQTLSGASLTVPILLYHYTPANFEQQLQTISARGYTTISLDQLLAGFANPASLPARSVVITLDDGYADQLKAASLLEKYQMKATFYIITGGAASNWCIGADRHTSSCGDSYLNWDQIRALDANPLFTIGAHTVDHLHLSSEPVDVQRYQITQSKATIEAQLGHTIKHFCYPYGSYNATTVSLVHESGFLTATTTASGTVHRSQDLLTLSRIRDTKQLP
jgi:peptidoglycan/xylan/chitin deacetylase (PgdA/CDA1 family)